MIKLDNRLKILEHSNYPALMSEPSYGDSLYTTDIYCEGFNELTGVGIQNHNGYACEQNYIEYYVQHIRPDTFRIAKLPAGYTITFQQHPEGVQELVTDDRDDLTVENWNNWLDEMEENLGRVIKEETEAKVQNKLQEMFLEDKPKNWCIPEEKGNCPVTDDKCTCRTEIEEPKQFNYTYLEAFEELEKRARNWWFSPDWSPDEAREAKAKIGLEFNALIGTLEMVKMYIASGDWDGIREAVKTKPEIVESEFMQMFGNRIKYTLNTEREALGKKIVLWAQGL